MKAKTKQVKRAKRTAVRMAKRRMAKKRKAGNSTRVRALPAAYIGDFKSVGATGYLSGNKLILKHREPLVEISEATHEKAYFFLINPGNTALMKWGSKIAGQYESYRFRKLKMHFRTKAPTSFAGRIRMYTDYDPRDPIVTSFDAMANYGAVEYPVYTNGEMVCNPVNLNKIKSRYVREINQPTLGDLGDRLTDAGIIYVWVQSDYPGVVGTLWVEYEVELETPQFSKTNNPTIAAGAKQPMWTPDVPVVSPISLDPDSKKVANDEAINEVLLNQRDVNEGLKETGLKIDRPGLYELRVSGSALFTHTSGLQPPDHVVTTALAETLGTYVTEVNPGTAPAISPYGDTDYPDGILGTQYGFGASPDILMPFEQVKLFNVHKPTVIAARTFSSVDWNGGQSAGVSKWKHDTAIRYTLTRINDAFAKLNDYYEYLALGYTFYNKLVKVANTFRIGYI